MSDLRRFAWGLYDFAARLIGAVVGYTWGLWLPLLFWGLFW